MWLIARGAMGDVAGGRPPTSDAPLLPCPRVQHRRGPPDPGEQADEQNDQGRRWPAPALSASSTSTASQQIDGVEVVSLVGRELAKTKEVADKYGIGHVTDRPGRQPGACKDVDAVILCTPTQMHAAQAIACLKAGKHVQVEIPLADTLAGRRGGRRVAEDRPAGRDGAATPAASIPATSTCTRRSGRRIQHPADGRADLLLPPHQHERAGPAAQLDRSPALAPRGAHGGPVPVPDRRRIVEANAVQGPIHPKLGIAMDMSIQLKSSSGAICTLCLSFNNDGPLGTFFRYIGDTAHLHRALRRPVQRQGREDRRVQGRRVDERHRAAGPRVLRRDPRRPRAQFERGAGAALLSHAGCARAPTQGAGVMTMGVACVDCRFHSIAS